MPDETLFQPNLLLNLTVESRQEAHRGVLTFSHLYHHSSEQCQWIESQPLKKPGAE